MPKNSLIVKIKDEEWCGVFVDLIDRDVPNKSVLEVHIKDGPIVQVWYWSMLFY